MRALAELVRDYWAALRGSLSVRLRRAGPGPRRALLVGVAIAWTLAVALTMGLFDRSPEPEHPAERSSNEVAAAPETTRPTTSTTRPGQPASAQAPNQDGSGATTARSTLVPAPADVLADAGAGAAGVPPSTVPPRAERSIASSTTTRPQASTSAPTTTAPPANNGGLLGGLIDLLGL